MTTENRTSYFGEGETDDIFLIIYHHRISKRKRDPKLKKSPVITPRSSPKQE